MEKGTNKMPRAKANANMTLKELRASYARRISELEAQIAFIDQMAASGSDHDLPGVPTTERKKPGPKPGWKKGPKAKKVAQVAAPKKKPGPKPKAQKAQAKPPTKKAAATAQPTKKAGTSKPRLIDAIQQVVGTKTMNALEIHGELKKRHWLPNSDDPLGYIRYTLSANKEIFLRVEGQRGHYHLDKGKTAVNGKAAAKPAAPKAPKAEPAAQTAAETPKVEPPKAVPPPAVKAAPPPPPPPVAVSKPAGEDEDPAAVADDILSRAGIDLGGLT